MTVCCHPVKDSMPAARAVQHAGGVHYPVGKNLEEIRRRQEANRVREVYDEGHKERLEMFTSERRPNLGSKVHCSAVHPAGCTVCQTCHFCRQKTTDPKTFCPCGDAAGIWCGKCLDIRMGENIHEVLRMCQEGKWSCPVCRDLCNCSGARCLRLSRGWEPTSQLASEARHNHYRSVAHYLVYTALDNTLPRSSAMPLVTGRYVPRPSRGGVQQQQAENASSRRRQQAQRELADIRKACQAKLQYWAGLRQEVARECDMGLDVLGAGAEQEEEEEEEELLRHRLPPAAGLLSPYAEVAGPGVPSPLFAGPGGSAAAAGPYCRQQQQQRRVGSFEPQRGAAPAAAGGSSDGRAAAAAGGAAGSGEQRVLGLCLPPTELGVLGIRGCTPVLAPATAGASMGADRMQEQEVDGTRAQATGIRTAHGAAGAVEQFGGTPGRQHSRAVPEAAGGTPRQQQPLRPGPLQQQQQPPRSDPPQQQSPRAGVVKQQHAVPAAAPGSAAVAFGADDLPGAEAPGYRDASTAAEHRARRQGRLRFSSGLGGASRTPPLAASRGHSRQRTVGAQFTAHCASRPVSAAAAAGRAGPEQVQDSILSPRDSRPGSASAARTAGASSSFAAGTVATAEAARAVEDEDVVLVEPTQMHGAAGGATAAAAAVAAAAAMAAPSRSDGEADLHPERSMPSEAASSPRRPAITQPGQLDSTEFVASEANSPLYQAERMQRELLMLMKSHPGICLGGLPYEELCERLKDLMDVAFGDWSDQQAGTLIHDGTGSADSTCSLETLQRACRLLVFLANYAPLEADRDPSCDDIVRRLSNLDFFVDFKGSGCDARQELIDTAREILEVFDDRQKPYSAVEMAYIAQGSPEPTSGHASTVQLAQAALRAVKLARQGMADTVECLLGWMAVLHEEATEVQRLMTTPTDLLQARKLGPIQWAGTSSLRRQEWASMSNQQQLQEEAELREVRRLQLETLQYSNGVQTAAIAMYLSTVAASTGAAHDHPPRVLARQVLESEVVPQVLRLDVNYPAEVRQALYTMVGRLLRKVAPDLQHPSAWQVDVSDMRQVLRGLSQQPQELQQLLPGQTPPASSEQLWAQAEDLLLHVMGQQLQPAARQQELSELHSNIGQQLLDPVEELVTAEYQIRAAGPDNKVKPFGQSVSRWQRESRQVGVIKVDVLAALYALQLQAGQTWQQVQALVVQPYDDLTSFFARRSPDQRRFVLYLVSQIVRSAPSLLQWDATAASSSIPAVDLLRLWLRSMLDQHPPKAFGKCMEHVTRVLAHAPATEQLFSFLSEQLQPGVLQDIFQRDCGIHQSGDQRARLLKVVLERLRDSRGEAALKQTLQELLRVLAPWQKKDAEDTSTTVRAIRWQRTCLLSLLQLTQLVLQYPSLDATVSLTELVKTATKWLQDGIKALCGQLVEQQPAVQKSAWEAAATPAAALSEDGSSRGSNMINSPNAIYVQASALQHLAPYLGLIVRLAGHAGKLEVTPTNAWPAAAVASSSSSSSGQLLSAAVQAAHPKAGQLPTSLKDRFAGLFCLRDLLGLALSLMGGQDQPGEHDSALLSHLASALAQQSGLLPGLADPQGLLKGYSSPGLLHHVLSIYVQAALKDAELGTDMAVHRGVNAMHLVSRLFAQLLQPGSGDPQLPLLHACTQQLLLPCLADPLVKLAGANVSSVGCCRVQLHVYRLLQQLLTGPLEQPLLPPPGQLQADQRGFSSGFEGALRKMAPIPQADLQQMMYHLVRLSLRGCLLIAAAATKTDASALHTLAHPTSSAASQLQSAGQQQHEQQQQQPQSLQKLFQSEVTSTNNLLRRLLGWVPRIEEALKLHPPVGRVAASPEDSIWRALEAGIRFAVQLAQHPGAAREAVTDVLFPGGPCSRAQRSIYHAMCAGRAGVKGAYTALVGQLTSDEQQRWRLPAVSMPQPSQRAPAQQQQQHPYRHQSQQQQQQEALPPQPGKQQQQQAQRPGQQHKAVANLPAAWDSSQACSQLGRPAGMRLSAGNGVVDLEASQMPFSEAGGKVASCSVPPGGQVGSAAAARTQRKRAASPVAAAGQVDRDHAEVSSRSQHKKQRASNAAADQPQHVQQQELPDVFSQDQGRSQGDATQPQPHVQHDDPQEVQEQQRGQQEWQESRQRGVPQPSPKQAGQEQRQDLPPGQQQPIGQQQRARFNVEKPDQQHQQQQASTQPGCRESRSKSGSGDSASHAGYVSIAGYITNAGRPSGSTLPMVYVADAPFEAKSGAPAYDYCAELSGKLVTSFDQLAAKKLLKACGRILLTKVYHLKSDQPHMQPTSDSELLVDPDAAAAAGVMYSEEQRAVWEACWRRLEGRRRRSEGKGRLGSQGTQLQPARQQLPHEHSQQQQPQQQQQPGKQPQPRQLHQQQGSADAAGKPWVSMQPLPRLDALKKAEPAVGHLGQTTRAATAADQADGEAAGQPQAGTKEPQAAAGADCCIEDSQATIKYPTLLSQL